MTPATPLDAPATPAAQPYGSYKPTEFDKQIANVVHDRVIFSNGDQAVVVGRTNGRIH